MANAPVVWLGSALVGFLLLWKIWFAKKKKASVKDKVVMITGASSGLGEACAHVFYNAGAKVILCARRKDELERVKQDLQHTSGHEPVVVVMDLSKIEEIPSKVQEALSSHGGIDILINNGGMSYRGKVVETGIDVDMKLMTVNYFGQIALTKAILPSMMSRGYGHIVVVSSLQGKLGVPYRSAYAASKHALQAFFDCLRFEVADKNIHISVLSPGYIKTNLSLNAVTGKGTQYGVMDSTTAGGMSPSAVADQVLQAVQYQDREILSAPLVHRLAVYIRNISPTLYFALVKARTAKQEKAIKDQSS